MKHNQIEQSDIDQERALALLESRDPDEAERKWKLSERYYYNGIACYFDPWGADGLEGQGSPNARVTSAPLPIRPYTGVRRSDESIEKRLAYTRNWFKEHPNYQKERRAKRRQDASKGLAVC